MKTASKPKKLSKTKQELRRLRLFAASFLRDPQPGENAFDAATLRVLATYALTGKKAPG